MVVGDGSIVNASDNENPDLFWGLKGGGPSTFAVVLSVTLKTYPVQNAAGVIVNINSTLTNDTNAFWDGVTSFHKYSNTFVTADSLEIRFPRDEREGFIETCARGRRDSLILGDGRLPTASALLGRRRS